MTPSDPDAGPARRPEAPTPHPHPFDPADPTAPGYDAASPAFRVAARAAAEDPRLELAFQGRLANETARFRVWADAWRTRGAGGCGWSSAARPFRPTEPAVLLDRARAGIARQDRWRASPAGRLAAALARAEADADALQAALEEARAAVDRADGSLLARAEAAAAVAGRLQASALGLRAAVSDAGLEPPR